MKKIEYRSINGNDVFDAPANTLKIICIFGILGAWIRKPFKIIGFFVYLVFRWGGKAESTASHCLRSLENQKKNIKGFCIEVPRIQK